MKKRYANEKLYRTVAKTAKELEERAASNGSVRTKRDRAFFAVVAGLYAKYPKHYVKMLLSEKHKAEYGKVVGWVYAKTAFLEDTPGFSYDLQTRLNWIVNGKDLSARCAAGCGNVPALRRKLRMNDPFPEYCCQKCATSSPAVIGKARQTRYSRNGGEWMSEKSKEKAASTVAVHIEEDPNYYAKRTAKCEETKVRNGHDPKWNNREKAKETVARHSTEDSGYYRKITAKAKATKERNTGDPNWVNPAKAKATNMGLYGVDSPMKRPDVKEKSKATFRRNHPGLTSSFQLPGVWDRILKNWMASYGVDNPAKVPAIQKKRADTMIRLFGVDCSFKDPATRMKIRKTCLARYGNEFYHGVKYKYDGILFDSSWEIAFWIFCKDAGIDIKREPFMFTYQANGKQMTYIPDFEVFGAIVEIKGNQFKSDEYGWINPWTKEPMTEKYMCAVQHGVVILYYEDIQPILEYISKKYGKSYLKQFLSK